MTDTAEYLEELAQTLASHGSNLAALRMAELEQKVSPYLAPPGVPTRQVGSDIVANTLGNVSPVLGPSNLLRDPHLDGWSWDWVAAAIEPATGAVCATSWQGTAWRIARSDTSCSVNTEMGFDRLSVYSHITEGNALVSLTASGAGTHSAYLYCAPIDLTVSPASLPYLVTALKVFRQSAAPAGVTAARARVELWQDATGSAVAASDWLDLLVLPAMIPARLDCAALTSAIFPTGDQYSPRLTLEITTTGAASACHLYFGEPQMHYGASPAPQAFSPALATSVPAHLAFLNGPSSTPDTAGFVQSRVFGDTYDRLNIVTSGALRWGSGAADVDTRLRRSGTKTLTIDDTAAGAATLNVVGAIQNGGTRVVGSRKGGWGVPTGTAERAAFDTASVTTAQLAQRVKALIDDLWLHGLIGGADAGHASATGAAYSPTVVIT